MSLYMVFSPEFDVACDCIGGFCRYEQERWMVYADAENRSKAKARVLKEFRKLGFDFDSYGCPFTNMIVESIDDWDEDKKIDIRNGRTSPSGSYSRYWEDSVSAYYFSCKKMRELGADYMDSLIAHQLWRVWTCDAFKEIENVG